jgi:ATP-binding cassette subfamily C protein CydC
MRQVAHIARLFWRAERGWFVAGIAASATTILAGIALLGLAGWFIAATALAGLAGAGLSFIFFAPSAGIRLLALARTGSRYAERLVTHGASLRFLAVLRVDLFRGLAALKAPSLARWRGAEMLQRLTSDVDALDNLYLRLILPVAVLVLTAVALLLMCKSGGVWRGDARCWWAAWTAVGARAGRAGRRRLAAAREARVSLRRLVRAQTDLAVSGSLVPKQSARKPREPAEPQGSRCPDLVSGAMLSLLGATALLAMFLLAAGEFQAGRIDGPVLVSPCRHPAAAGGWPRAPRRLQFGRGARGAALRPGKTDIDRAVRSGVQDVANATPMIAFTKSGFVTLWIACQFLRGSA